MIKVRKIQGLFAAPMAAVLVGCGGGGGGSAPASPLPPGPSAVDRSGYARPVYIGGGVAIVDPATPNRLIVIEPAGSVRDSRVIYEADINPVSGVAANPAPRYVLYVKQGRLFRYDARDRGQPAQVTSATDVCEFSTVDNPSDIDRAGLILYLAGPDGVCNFGTGDDERAYAAPTMSAATPIRKFDGQFAFALHDVQGVRTNWLVTKQALVGGLGGYAFSFAPPDFSVAPTPVGSIAGTFERLFEASGGVYFRSGNVLRYLDPVTRSIVDAARTGGQWLGRSAGDVYVLEDGSSTVVRYRFGGAGPETPVVVGSVPPGYYGIGHTADSLWFGRAASPRDVLRVPVSGGNAQPAGTFVQPLSGRLPIYSVVQFGTRTLVVDSQTGESIIALEPGAAARTLCCYVDAQIGRFSADGATSAQAIVLQRMLNATSTQISAVTSPEAAETIVGVIGPPPAGFFTGGIVTRDVGQPRLTERNFGSIGSISRNLFVTGGAPSGTEVYVFRPATASSLSPAAP